MLDRACYFGDGVYDFSLAYNGKIFALDEHVDRLYRSASMIEIEIPYTKAEMKTILQEAVSRSEYERVSVYWQVSAEPRLEIMFFRMRERRRIS